MLTVEEASQAIAESMSLFDSEQVEVDEAAGRVLRQTVTAERDQPPFDRVTMDGIAIRFASVAGGKRTFAIAGTQHAGDPVKTLGNDDGCIEIMTGGVLPLGTDCIIPVERISVADGHATVEADYTPAERQFIHARGSDHVAGTEVLQPGTRISPMDVAIIASCGLDEVAVGELPAIRVISTGNELVPAGEPVEAHQVRLSNGPALVAMLTQQGFIDSAHEHLIDEPEILEARIDRLLMMNNVLILSGGVSMGKADYVPDVLRNLGVEVVFHKISQRPGKPMWFGIGPDRQVVFALPGNPVSTLVCCRHYVLPALLQACGRTDRAVEMARLAEAVTFKADLTCFLPVRLSSSQDGAIVATPVPTNTSGDFASLGGTDGYVELSRVQSEFPAGSVVPLHRWNQP
jgi:molybdopterin molybdotransferase